MEPDFNESIVGFPRSKAEAHEGDVIAEVRSIREQTFGEVKKWWVF